MEATEHREAALRARSKDGELVIHGREVPPELEAAGGDEDTLLAEGDPTT